MKQKENIRMQNIIRAREAWRLKLEGFTAEETAKHLSTSEANIKGIFKYTDSGHYNNIKKSSLVSYYDANSFHLKTIEQKKEELEFLAESIKQKKKLLREIIIGTMIILLIILMF